MKTRLLLPLLVAVLAAVTLDGGTPSWSPDGTSVVYSASDGLYVVRGRARPSAEADADAAAQQRLLAELGRVARSETIGR